MRSARSLRGTPVGLAGESNVLPGREVVVDARLLSHVADGLADLAGSPTTSNLLTRTEPALGRNSVDNTLIVVVLPAPFGPRNPEQFAFGNLQVDVANGLRPVAVGQFEAVDVDGVLSHDTPSVDEARSPFTARLSNATDKYCRAPSPNDPAPDRFGSRNYGSDPQAFALAPERRNPSEGAVTFARTRIPIKERERYELSWTIFTSHDPCPPRS